MKQDDFVSQAGNGVIVISAQIQYDKMEPLTSQSDVEDLLPPLAERSQIRSLEDEARAATAQKAQKANAFQSVVSTLPSRPASGATAPPTRPSLVNVPVTSSFDSPAKALPSSVGVADAELGIGASGSGLASERVERAGERVREAVGEVAEGSRGLGSYLPLPQRLDTSRWLRERGQVELGKGNVIVWGAPNAENIGRVSDGGITRNKGGRLV